MFKCYSRFMLNKDLKRKVYHDGGRHQDENLMHWFGLLIQWLESESGAELYTLSELHSKMVEFSKGSDVYSIKRLKQRFMNTIKNTYFLLQWRAGIM